MEDNPSRMPGSDTCYVEEGKIKDYLLNESHPRGGGKAKFFVGFGFSAKDWRTFEAALIEHGASGVLAGDSLTSTGNVQYEVDGRLRTPLGERPQIRTVWERHGAEDHYPEGLRLVTAFHGGAGKPKTTNRR